MSEKRPNIVLIMADDLGYECLGCYGGTSYRTPNLDGMARNGIRFDHCYSTPLCTPSRVQIMTGKYNFRNYRDFGYLDPEELTFANLLQEAGYRTGIAGKWQLNGLRHKWPRWDDTSRPYDAGFDEYCLWQLTKGTDAGERYWDPLIMKDGEFLDLPEGSYGPDIFCDYVCDFIERNVEGPFFAYYPMVLTHSPFLPTPDSSSKEQDIQANFSDMAAYTDKIVGKILQKLDDLGIREETVVLFTGDNGTSRSIVTQMTGRTVAGGKGTLPDAGTHVPLLVSWPGRTPRGFVCEDLTDFTDILPTLAELSGAEIPADFVCDGKSLVPRILGEGVEARSWVFCHYEPHLEHQDENRGRFVRTRRFKLYHDGRFYDIPKDVLERTGIDLSDKDDFELELKKHEREKLQAILDLMPPWKPEPEM